MSGNVGGQQVQGGANGGFQQADSSGDRYKYIFHMNNMIRN